MVSAKSSAWGTARRAGSAVPMMVGRMPGTRHAAELFLHLLQRLLGAGEKVVDALAGDPGLLGDFSQGEILVIV